MGDTVQAKMWWERDCVQCAQPEAEELCPYSVGPCAPTHTALAWWRNAVGRCIPHTSVFPVSPGPWEVELEG